MAQKEKELTSLLDQLGKLNARLEVLDKKIREQHEEVQCFTDREKSARVNTRRTPTGTEITKEIFRER